MATISWGTPVFGAPVWTPTAPFFARGTGFAPGILMLYIGQGYFPPAPGINSISASGTYDVTIPFVIKDGGGTVNAILAGGVNGLFFRFGSPKTFFLQYLLFPTLFNIQGRVEIRNAAGAVIYEIPQSGLHYSTTMFRRGSKIVTNAGLRPNCNLVIGTTYQLYCQLTLTFDLSVLRIGNMTATQGVSVANDLLTGPNYGLWYAIVLPIPAPVSPPPGDK